MSSNERQSTHNHVTYTNHVDDTHEDDDKNKLSMNKRTPYLDNKKSYSFILSLVFFIEILCRGQHWLVISFLNTCIMSYRSVTTMMMANVTAVYLTAYCVNTYYIKKLNPG